MLFLAGTAAETQNSGFSGENRYITPAALAYNNKYTQIAWGGDVQREDCGKPLACGDKVLLPVGDTVVCIDESTGAETQSVALSEKCSCEYSGAIIGGTLLQPTESGIAVIDAENMALQRSISLGGSVSSDCAVIDGSGYIAVQINGDYEMQCIDLESDTASVLWSVKTSGKPSAPAVQGDYVIFAAESSIFVCDYQSGSFSEIPVGKTVTGAPFTTEYAVFFSTADGNAGKLRLNSDGTLEEGTLTFCKVGANPSTPVSWNGRLYVCADDGLYVLDNLNMDVSYVLSDIKGGCTPQIHYGSGPYIYTVGKYEDGWAVYCVLDDDDTEEPTYTILARVDYFEAGAFCGSTGGSLYVLDDIGRLYSLTIVPFDVVSLVIKLIVLLALIALVFVWLKKVIKRKDNLRPKY